MTTSAVSFARCPLSLLVIGHPLSDPDIIIRFRKIQDRSKYRQRQRAAQDTQRARMRSKSRIRFDGQSPHHSRPRGTGDGVEAGGRRLELRQGFTLNAEAAIERLF